MARPRHPIDQHRDYITHLYLNGVSRSRIIFKLRKHHHVTVNRRTLSRRIANWGLPRQQARTKESPELIDATHDLIFRIGLTEKQTLSVLQRQGWPITKRGLKRIRLHPDRRWLRRLNTEEERLALLERTEQAIIEITIDRIGRKRPLIYCVIAITIALICEGVVNSQNTDGSKHGLSIAGVASLFFSPLFSSSSSQYLTAPSINS